MVPFNMTDPNKVYTCSLGIEFDGLIGSYFIEFKLHKCILKNFDEFQISVIIECYG